MKMTFKDRLQRDCFRFLSAIIMCGLIFLAGCDGGGIKVPSSDQTPPTAKLEAIISSTVGDEAIELTSESSPVTKYLQKDKPIKFLAVATDKDGGIKNIAIKGGLTVFCKGTNLGAAYELAAINPDEAEVGDTALKTRATSMLIDPAGYCTESSIEKFQGSVAAIAENFHGGIDQTAGFGFEISP